MEKDIVIKGKATPAKLLTLAIKEKAGAETLTELMALQERYEDNEARKAYHVAMAAFKKDPPVIVKDKEVKYGQTSYKHAGLAEAAASIGKALSAQGLSAAWRTEQKDKEVTVTCEITHILGHTESTSLSAPPDNSGSKNSIQAIASTVTYLSRHTLMCITGLAASDADDDGRGYGNDTKCITDTQAADLAAFIDETGTDTKKFCEHFKVDSLEVMPVGIYPQAIVLLEEKRKRSADTAQ